MAKLVLVDGSSYLYRAFHALPDLRTSRGEPTGAVRGVLAMLRRLVAEQAPDYFAVIFDAPGKTFRDDWYPEYKANRPAMPQDLAVQIPWIHELIGYSGWPLLMESGVEADDVIGTLTTQAVAAGVSVLISTGDKDLAQLVQPGVTLVNTMSNEVLDEPGVIAKFGVYPRQIVDYLALVGDSVDNVPGVPKCGPKTAVKWLHEFGTLENLLAHAGQVSGVVGQHLREQISWLPQAKRLVTVRCDVSLPIDWSSLGLSEPQQEALTEAFNRFEFKSWLKELTLPAASTPGSLSHGKADLLEQESSGLTTLTREYPCILQEADLDAWLTKLYQAELVAFDTETDSLDPLSARLVGLSFAVAAGEACYIPLSHDYPGAPSQLALQLVLDRLKPWFADVVCKKVAQNAKYDWHVLANHGVTLRGVVFDTLLESYVWEAHKPHDLGNLALRHLQLKTIAYADLCGKGAKQISFSQVDVDLATAYSAEDADLTWRLHYFFDERISQEPGLIAVYQKIEMPVLEVLWKMERYGVLLDANKLAQQSQELAVRLNQLESEAHALAGMPFNLASPKQLGEVLFEQLKLPIVRKTATGQLSTDEEVLETLAADYPLPKLLLEHRSLSKLKSTYTDKLPKMINPRTGRVHTNFAQAVAITGRLSSTDPNLQNIPIRTAEGRRIREAFIAPVGWKIVSADYSQIELRIMAHLSEDEHLVEAFQQGLDIHKATAAEIFSVAIDAVTPEQRRYTKAVNFGLIYGMSAWGLAAQLGVGKAAAQSFMDRYFARYPGVAKYMADIRVQAHEKGYVETIFGRRLWLTDIRAGGGPRRQAAERAAINAPMQGTAADLIKLAMIRVQNWLEGAGLQSRLVLQVHDELVLEVPESELSLVKEQLLPAMTQVAQLKVPLVVEVGVGENWEQAH